MVFHTFVMSRITNDVGLLVYRLFSFPVCWLAASLRFSQRLSEALSNWYNGNKSGVGNFINNKQRKNETICSASPDGSWNMQLQLGFTVDCRFKSACWYPQNPYILRFSWLFTLQGDISKSFKSSKGESMLEWEGIQKWDLDFRCPDWSTSLNLKQPSEPMKGRFSLLIK